MGTHVSTIPQDYGKIKEAQAALPVERAMRIELTTAAWEAAVLPLNYARKT